MPNEAEATDSNRRRLPPLANVVRLTAGVFGLSGFTLGAIIAWRSSSATPLLVVSAAMLVVAALGLEWTKIRGSYGGWAVEILRGVSAQIEQTKSLAITAANVDDTPSAALTEVVQRLDTLDEQMKAFALPARKHRPTGSAPSTASISHMVRDLFTTKATRSFMGRESVTLKLHAMSDAETFDCTVTTPSGGAYAARTRKPITLGIVVPGINDYQVTYPDEFRDAEPLLPGRYEVEWRPSVRVAAGEGTIAQVLAAATMPPTATDSFTIPGTEPLRIDG